MTRGSDALAILAAIMGAAGVALAAASTHSGGGDLGRTASEFLVLHAAALLGLAAHLRGAAPARARALMAAGALLAIGTLLFAADLGSRAFLGDRLFPFAAPLGGSAMILAWAAAALAFALTK